MYTVADAAKFYANVTDGSAHAKATRARISFPFIADNDPYSIDLFSVGIKSRNELKVKEEALRKAYARKKTR